MATIIFRCVTHFKVQNDGVHCAGIITKFAGFLFEDSVSPKESKGAKNAARNMMIRITEP
ncbi:MAG TPA: hypothetical protein VNT20_23560 [Flavisolibacter sp.]|jgi:hypothetical protein|nr:hypothetical protein [Flavisolibacter sp.]